MAASCAYSGKCLKLRGFWEHRYYRISLLAGLTTRANLQSTHNVLLKKRKEKEEKAIVKGLTLLPTGSPTPDKSDHLDCKHFPQTPRPLVRHIPGGRGHHLRGFGGILCGRRHILGDWRCDQLRDIHGTRSVLVSPASTSMLVWAGSSCHVL